jgi:hypothetical protein
MYSDECVRHTPGDTSMPLASILLPGALAALLFSGVGCAGATGPTGEAAVSDDTTPADTVPDAPEAPEGASPGEAGGTVDPGSGTVDPGSGTVDPGSGTVDPGAGTVDPGAGTVDPGAGGVTASGLDAYGIRELYPSAASGQEWRPRWNEEPRTLTSPSTDPLDPMLHVSGSNTVVDVQGDGTARISGDTIRLHVRDDEGGKLWLNTELTVYGKRVSETGRATNPVGFEFQLRGGEGHNSSDALGPDGYPIQCQAQDYGFSFRYDGRALMEKELKHPEYTSQVAKNVWDGGTFPVNQWVGMKFVAYNVDDGHVKLEIWRDLTDGADGGRWEKVNEYTDAGGWSVDAAVAESCGIEPDRIINYPQPVVVLRNDGISEMWYKNVSVREIQP